MNADPYRVSGPACISFSGGRTSAYMLRRILDAHGGSLPADAHVIFANTGKEHPGTLDFVRDCSVRWGVAITWVEYDGRGGKLDYREVTHDSASRAGEPFARLIEQKKALPNWQARWCTAALKVQRARARMRSLGHEEWTDFVGLRADEPRRVAKRKAASDEDDEVTYALPLATAGVTEADVLAYWRTAPFKLRVPYGAGNCDLCYLKGTTLLRARIEADPAASAWWESQETSTGHTFANRFTYAGLRAEATAPRRQLLLFDEPTLPCACTD